MKFKFLLASAVAIVGIAVYTLTLSFTHSAPLLSQLEALADGEGGDGGNTGGESGESSESENPESGQSGGKYKPYSEPATCIITIIEKNPITGATNTLHKEINVWLIKGCPEGDVAETCAIEDCSKYSSF